MAKYLIDSNILIYALKGIHEASSVISKLIDSDENKIKIDNLLGQLIRVDYNYKIEEYIINFSKVKKIKIPDAIIAASAIHTNSVLVTRNTIDFQNIPNLKLLNPFES